MYVGAYKSEKRNYKHNELDAEIRIKADMPRLQRQRNDAIRNKARELENIPGSTIKIDWKGRSILVNGKVKWRQARDSPSLELVE